MLRAVLAAALLLAAALAGCAERPDVESAAAQPSPIVFTSPGMSAANATGVADAPHLHDYWNGAETLVIMDGAYETGTFVFSEWREFDLRPEPGRVIPQGTLHVDVTLDWVDDPHDVYAQPELWVKTAEDNQPWLVGPITKGEPLRIDSTNERNDLPHQTLSAWIFQVRMYPNNEASLIWWEGEFQVHVAAHRGLDIPLFPPHPDPWQGAVELPLLEHATSPFAARGNPDEGNMCFFGCFEILTPSDGAVVPWDAALVEVTLTMGAESPTQLGLSFHGADTREFARIAPDTVEGKTRVYRIPLAEGMGDGPYSKQSLWELRVYPEEPVENEWHVGSYTLSARVLKSA